MAEATVQLFASYFGPRKLSASNAAVDEVEVANWESAADRCSIINQGQVRFLLFEREMKIVSMKIV